MMRETAVEREKTHGAVICITNSAMRKETRIAPPRCFLFNGGASVRLGHKTLRTLLKRSSLWELPGVYLTSTTKARILVSWIVDMA